MTIAEVIVKLMGAENTLENIWGWSATDPHAQEFSDMLDALNECVEYLDGNLELFQKAEGR